MAYRIEYLLEVAEELAESYQWYESQSLGLGTQLLSEIGNALDIVRDHPLLCPTIDRYVRRALVRRFEFAIFFMVEGEILIVLAIVHASRNPMIWKRRARTIQRGENPGRWKDNL